MRIRLTLSTLLGLALLGGSPLLGAAHEEAPAAPRYTMIHFDQVVPAHADRFEENAKAWVEAFRTAGMGEDWSWRAASSDEFAYAYLFDFDTWAELDENEAREKKMAETLGEEKMKELMAGMEAVRSHHSIVLESLPELTYVPAEAPEGPPGFVLVTTYWVQPGKGEAFEKLVAKGKEGFAKVGPPAGFEVHRVVIGEGSYVITTLGHDASSVYGSPGGREVMVQAFGAEAAKKMGEEFLGMVVRTETENWWPRPDLAYLPAMESKKAAGD